MSNHSNKFNGITCSRYKIGDDAERLEEAAPEPKMGKPDHALKIEHPCSMVECRPQPDDDDVVRVLVITIGDSKNRLMMEAKGIGCYLEELAAELGDDETVTMSATDMTKGEIRRLPEWDGS